MSWEELYEELKPDIPFDKAKTVKQALEEINKDAEYKVNENHVRETLERKVMDEGWNKKKYRSNAYYWPPD